MKIEKIFYELYESDALWLKGKESSEIHEIDREVCIKVENDEDIYISWASEPIQFSIGYKSTSWNTNKPDTILDVSDWKMWEPVIGKEFKLNYCDDNHQILELNTVDTSIYFSSQEDGNWESDVLHISSKKPNINS